MIKSATNLLWCDHNKTPKPDCGVLIQNAGVIICLR